MTLLGPCASEVMAIVTLESGCVCTSTSATGTDRTRKLGTHPYKFLPSSSRVLLLTEARFS